jgi:hypothetical protein
MSYGEPYNEKSNGCAAYATNNPGYKIQYDIDGLHPLTGVKGSDSTLSEFEVYQLVIQ